MVNHIKFFSCILSIAMTATVVTPMRATRRFEGHNVISFAPLTQEHVDLLQSHLRNKALALNLWSHHEPRVHGTEIHVMVPAESGPHMRSLLRKVPHRVLIENVQSLVDSERTHALQHSYKLEKALALDPNMDIDAVSFFSDYQPLSTIDMFMKALPGVTALNVPGITTYQGRNITVYKFGSGPRHIVFNGGIHAREWIAPAVATFISHQLTTDPDLSTLLSNYTFHCIPVLNPDGYVETRVGDRFHRKNMEPNPCPSRGSIGTDVNRNFGFKWGGEGASSDPCDDVYQGSGPLSSAEAQALANYVNSLPQGMVISHIDFHSYSQLWMYPNGWSCDVNLKDDPVLERGSQIAVDALRSASTNVQGVAEANFRNGPVCVTIYKVSGSSTDYFYNVLNVTFSYAVELRDSGDYGFLLPASMIVPSGNETTAAVVALWRYMLDVDILANSHSSSATKIKSVGWPWMLLPIIFQLYLAL